MPVFDNNAIIDRSNFGSLTVTNEGSDVLMDIDSLSTGGNSGISGLLPLTDIIGTTEFSISFKRHKIGSRYDNDYTEAFLAISFFPDSEPDDVPINTASWKYNRFGQPPNGAINIWFKEDATDVGSPLFVIEGLTSNQISYPSEINEPFDGTHTLTIKMVPDEIDSHLYTWVRVLNESGVLCAEARIELNMVTLTKLTAGIHFHNYNAIGAEQLNSFVFKSTAEIYTVTGNVTTSNGRAVEGRLVFIHDEIDYKVVGTGYTDKDGKFSIDINKASSVMVRVVDPDQVYNTQTRENIIPEKEIID